MERYSVEVIVRELNTAQVRYLVVGGLAVVAHGYVRFTADVDLVIDLEPVNVARALAAFKRLGYRSRAPVELEDFADPQKRAAWVRDKGLTVFSLYSASHAATEVDLFVEAPLNFDAAYRGAARLEVAPGVPATFVGLPDLLHLKRQAGRVQDRLDIEQLETLGRAKRENPPS
jgi:hypothetical protein